MDIIIKKNSIIEINKLEIKLEHDLIVREKSQADIICLLLNEVRKK